LSSEQLGVRGGPLRHRLSWGAGEVGDQVVCVLRMIDGAFDLVEIPRRVRAKGLLELRFGFDPVAPRAR